MALCDFEAGLQRVSAWLFLSFRIQVLGTQLLFCEASQARRRGLIMCKFQHHLPDI